jgi:hypothetical protein
MRKILIILLIFFGGLPMALALDSEEARPMLFVCGILTGLAIVLVLT